MHPADPTGERLTRVLEALRNRTVHEAADWAAGSRPDSYLYSGRKSSVVLQTKDKDGLPPYEVVLLDADGRMTLSWITDTSSSDPIEARIFKSLHEIYLFVSARLGPAADVLNDLEQELLGDGNNRDAT